MNDMGDLRGSSFSPSVCMVVKRELPPGSEASSAGLLASPPPSAAGTAAPATLATFISSCMEMSSVTWYFPVSPVMSTIGWSTMGDSPSASSARVAPQISKRIDLPSGDGVIFCCLPAPSETTAPPLVWLTLTELLPVTAGLGAAPSGGAAGCSLSSIFRRPLPITKAYTAWSFDSRWITSLKRSASRACSICGTCSLVAPSGRLATMSNRCPDKPTVFSQEGPETWYALTSYALQINCISPKFPISTRLPSIFIPACSFPEATMAGVIGSEGLTEATSNVGVCASSDPPDNNMMATLKDGNKLFDTAIHLAIGALSDIDDGGCNRLLTRWTRRGRALSAIARLTRSTPATTPLPSARMRWAVSSSVWLQRYTALASNGELHWGPDDSGRVTWQDRSLTVAARFAPSPCRRPHF